MINNWLLALTLYIALSNAAHEAFNGRRYLKYVNPVIDRGNSSLISSISVFAASILSWHGKEVFCTDTKCPLSMNESTVLYHRQQLQAAVPIPIVEWRFINSKSCPHHSSHSHKLDRGLGISHLQIWLEFVFFDHDTDEARFRPNPEYLTSNSWSSASGIFQAFQNETRLKNGMPYLDEDIMVVFEDGVHSSRTFNPGAFTADLTAMLRSQKSNSSLTVDVMILGHCSEMQEKANSHHRHSMCPFAYALTRRGAARLSNYFDICGRRLDQQLANLAAVGLLTVNISSQAHFVIGQ